MVTTRSQYQRQLALQRIRNSVQRTRNFIKRYRPTDVTKRHRLPDRQPKSVRVISYARRN
jgi:hypothetical protein